MSEFALREDGDSELETCCDIARQASESEFALREDGDSEFAKIYRCEKCAQV